MPATRLTIAPIHLPRWLPIFGIAVLSVMLFCSAMGVIYHKHLSRQLFAQLQSLQHTVESLQVEWSQLLLEQGTWTADARIERYSRERLQMRLPEPNEVVVIKE